MIAAVGVLGSCAHEKIATDSPERETAYVDADGIVPGWVRIKLTDDAAPLRAGTFTRGGFESGNGPIDEVAARLGATEVRPVFPEDPRFEKRHRRYGLHLWYDIRIADDVAVTRAAADMANVPGVAHVEPIYYIYSTDGSDYLFPSEIRDQERALAASVTRAEGEMPFNDPMLPKQWHYDNDGSLTKSEEALFRPGADIGVFEVWKRGLVGIPEVIVAVNDKGIDINHPDLIQNLWINEGEIPGNGIDDDGNGYVDDVYGYNFWDNRDTKGRHPIEPGDHGTHVAGTIAAVNNNGEGVCGVAGGNGDPSTGVRLMSCQVYSPERSEGDEAVRAFVYSADNGAVISSNSWDYQQTAELPESMRVAIDYFIDNAGTDDDGNQTGPMKGGIVVFASGNAYETRVPMPAAYERVVTVAAMRPDFRKSSYSNSGPQVDIFAPGGAGSNEAYDDTGHVLSTKTVASGSYGYMSGTSMACPHVSGVLALILSEYGGIDKPGFTAQECIDILLKSYRQIGEYQPTEIIASGLGRGLVDVSLMGIEDPATPPAAPSQLVLTTKDTKEGTLYVEVTVPADGNGQAVANFEMSVRKAGGEWGEASRVRNYNGVGSVSNYTVDGLEDATSYEVRMFSIDQWGNVSTESTVGQGTTIDHINREPVIVKPLSPVKLPSEDGSYTAEIDLLQHFADNDPGDALTFEVESDKTDVATAEIIGSTLKITGVGSGKAYITITATDRGGLDVSRTMSATVTWKEPEPGCGCPPDCECGGTCGDDCQCGGDVPVTPPAETGGLSLVSEVVSSEVSMTVAGGANSEAAVTIYDSSAREVHTSKVALSEGSGKIGVGNLAPGRYTLVVEVGAARYTASFLKR